MQVVLDDMFLKWYWAAKLDTVEKKTQKAKKEDWAQRNEALLAELEGCKGNRDILKICRKLAYTGLGPKRRDYRLWQHGAHLATPANEGGWSGKVSAQG